VMLMLESHLTATRNVIYVLSSAAIDIVNLYVCFYTAGWDRNTFL